MPIEPVPEGAPISAEEWARMSKRFRRWTVELTARVKARKAEIAMLRRSMAVVRGPEVGPTSSGDPVAGQVESTGSASEAEPKDPAG